MNLKGIFSVDACHAISDVNYSYRASNVQVRHVMVGTSKAS